MNLRERKQNSRGVYNRERSMELIINYFNSEFDTGYSNSVQKNINRAQMEWLYCDFHILLEDVENIYGTGVNQKSFPKNY